MQNKPTDLVRRPMEQKDVIYLKAARNTNLSRLVASALFFFLFSGLAYYVEKTSFFSPAQEGAEGMEKIPFIIFCFLSFMMFIGIIRGFWKQHLLQSDLENGEKLCGTALFKKGYSVNKIPYLSFDLDKHRQVAISASYSERPRISRDEPIYVEIAPLSSVAFMLKFKNEEISLRG